MMKGSRIRRIRFPGRHRSCSASYALLLRCAKSNAIIAYCAGKNNGNFVFGLSGAQQRKARPVGFSFPAGRAVARCVAGALAQPSVQGLHQGTSGVLIQGPAAHAQQALLTDVGCLGGHGFRILVADEGAAVIEPGALGSLVKVCLLYTSRCV